MTEIKKLDNGFEYLAVINDAACVNIALQGAHIFHYARRDKVPALWLSDVSDFELGKAIRGGVPICWPSFGTNNPNLPQHGFARVFMFELVDVKEKNSSQTQVVFRLIDSKETIADYITMELSTINKDTKPFKLTQALHSYFNISHISNVTVEGLDKKPYFDAVTSKEEKQDKEIRFEEEVNRVYQEVQNEVVLRDKERSIGIKNEGSSSVVVWNPWKEKGSRMSAMKNDAYESFVCIESSNAFDDFKILEPNDTHTLKATIYCL